MRAKRSLVPLTVHIVAVFLAITALLAGTLTWYNFSRNSEATLLSADRLMNEMSSRAFERLRSVYDPIITLANQSATMPALSEKPSLLPHPASWFLLSAMERTPQLYSTFMGWEDGEFYQIINYSEDLEGARATQNAPDDARYALRHIFHSEATGWLEHWRFLNADRVLIDHRVGPASGYDPRSRIWYQQAAAREEVIKTNLYIFHSLQAGGLTLARRFDGEISGVFGVDLTLGSLSNFLAEQRASSGADLLVFSREGSLTAYPEADKVVRVVNDGPDKPRLAPAQVTDLGDPALTELIDLLQDDFPKGPRAYPFSVGDEEMMARVTPLPAPYGNDEYIAVVMPVASLVEPLVNIRTNSTIFSIIALLMAVPAIIYFSWRIAKPLRALAAEAEAIREFRLDGELSVRSNVSEVSQLADSIGTMKHTLQTFGLYVPKALVKRLVASGVQPSRGGDRRPLTLMFSDVAGFTTIADQTDPEDLMLHLSDYFQGLGTEIHRTGGTIDKYIGDAVMAFWNAPELDEHHATHACLSALRCRAVSQKLCAEAAAQGLPAFHTRFGVFTGMAVIGNMGSSDRMDYTAIGSAVNMAARLEGLNKQYRTEILVSDSVANAVGPEFLFRPLDMARPKGALQPLLVLELVGLAPGSGVDPALEVGEADPPFLVAWRQAWDHYRDKDWSNAEAAFSELSSKRPDDAAARLMAARCGAFLSAPPAKDWDGVTNFQTT